MAPADALDLPHGGVHVRGTVPQHDDVVGIVGNGEGDGAVFQTVALDEPQTDVPRGFMPLHYGEFQKIRSGDLHRAPAPLYFAHDFLGNDVAVQQADDLHEIGTGVQIEILFGKRRDMHRALHAGIGVNAAFEERFAAFRGEPSVFNDERRLEILQILHADNVRRISRAPARRNRAGGNIPPC